MALLRTLLAQRTELGIGLSVLHVEHGLRGEAATGDARFVAALTKEWDVPCEVVTVDTRKRAKEHKESIEEAARNLRYAVFREMLASGDADKVATAHTLDDQAETVLMKLLRGAWTEGLSGIHPVLRLENAGVCVRPLLGATRAQIEGYLKALGQPWREDESNRSPDYTRNRVRHELMPMLRGYNPQIGSALAHMAANARAEERHWQAELARVLPQLLLPGRPVRGGGRSVATLPGPAAVAVELARLRTLDAGLHRRVLRAAAEQCGATLDFGATERLVALAGTERRPGQGASARRLDLPGGVRVERTLRELQFTRTGGAVRGAGSSTHELPVPAYELPVPGTVEASIFQASYTAACDGLACEETAAAACVRAWRPGDRVELAHSREPKKVKEILERMGIRGEDRVLWPVVEWRGRIVWMRGVEMAGNNGTEAAPVIREIRSESKVTPGPANFTEAWAEE